jgi:eukaryotic-like serine/threonine-protein kinase
MQPSSELVGQILNGRYQIVALVGTGASANVYLAKDTTLERNVAVKVLQPALANDEAFLKRFRAEARAVAALNHPNVLRVFDWGEQDGVPYLVMEYLAGGSLKDLLDRSEELTPEQVALIGQQAAAGISYAHLRGLIHRDIKPANLLFDEEGRVRITDFGVARALAEASWTEPMGAMIGTVRYASPEQAVSAAVDEKADVYSLGLVLYEALTGEVPFLAETPLATLQARVGQLLPQDSALGPLDVVLEQATAPDPTSRFTAGEFEQRLASLSGAMAPPAPLPLELHTVENGEITTTVVGAAGVAGASLGFRAPSPDELTQITPAVNATGPVPAGVTAPVVADDATMFDQGFGAYRPERMRKSRRRWPWILGAVVLLALIFGGFAYATKLFVPSVSVPRVVGETEAGARAKLSNDHLNASFAPAVYSLKIPAGHIMAQTPGAGSQLKQGSTVTLVASRGLPPVTVPSLSGFTCPQAQAALQAVHLQGTCPPDQGAYSPTVPVNQVVSYSQGSATNPQSVPYGSTVVIVISKGPPPTPIPLVSGTFAQAQATLSAAGFQVVQANEFSTSVPTGQVTRTSPPAGALAQKGSTITVYVSLGPSTTIPSSIIGQSYATAAATLRAVGLIPSRGAGPVGGKVVSASPGAGTLVAQGSTVRLNTQ